MNLRNKPCQCGSGRKYKRCCGNNAEKARQYQEAFSPPLSIPVNTPPLQRANRRGVSSIALIAAAISLGRY
jgi:hypothetical protein